MEERTMDYSDFNNAFDKLMLGGKVRSGDDMSEVCTDGGFGRLIVRTVTANGALPVSGAKITIADSKGATETVLYTDESGRTEVVTLCVPPAKNSLTPGNFPTYGAYDILIEKNGYYTEEFLNVAVFDGIESIQNVSLEPLGEDEAENDRVRSIGNMPDKLSENGAGDRIIISEEPNPAVDMY